MGVRSMRHPPSDRPAWMISFVAPEMGPIATGLGEICQFEVPHLEEDQRLAVSTVRL